MYDIIGNYNSLKIQCKNCSFCATYFPRRKLFALVSGLFWNAEISLDLITLFEWLFGSVTKFFIHPSKKKQLHMILEIKVRWDFLWVFFLIDWKILLEKEKMLVINKLCFPPMLSKGYFLRAFWPFTTQSRLFIDPEKEAFWKNCQKRGKCWWQAFSPFPTMFSTHPKKNSCFQVKFFLSSADAFSLTILKLCLW